LVGWIKLYPNPTHDDGVGKKTEAKQGVYRSQEIKRRETKQVYA
jgi:hypothetical protein